MIPESITAVIARNERWSGEAASQPYEAGWAREAAIFLRALKAPVGAQPVARIEISPDGMHWLPEGASFAMPTERDGLACARVANFGNWLRVTARFETGAESTVLVSVHLKA